jgi:hypothetical protein
MPPRPSSVRWRRAVVVRWPPVMMGGMMMMGEMVLVVGRRRAPARRRDGVIDRPCGNSVLVSCSDRVGPTPCGNRYVTKRRTNAVCAKAHKESLQDMLGGRRQHMFHAQGGGP